MVTSVGDAGLLNHNTNVRAAFSARHWEYVKVERVPRLTEHTSWETELNQREIPMSLHVIVSARK